MMWPVMLQRTRIAQLFSSFCLSLTRIAQLVFLFVCLYHPLRPGSHSLKYLSLTDFRASKKARCHGSEEESEMEEDIAVFPNDECQFDDLCCEEAFNREAITKPGIENGSWGLLDDRVLARIFHFLKADVKSLVYAALTCTHWRSIVKIYKGISRQVDLLSIASSCTDSVLQKIMVCFCYDDILPLIFSPTGSQIGIILRSRKLLRNYDTFNSNTFFIHFFAE